MNLNSGINPELILLHFGLYIYFGINQALKKVTRTLKNDFCKKNYRIYIIKMDFTFIKEVLYLKYFADMDYAQIGEIMDLNYQSARNLSHRALEALRQILLIAFIVWLCNFFGLL